MNESARAKMVKARSELVLDHPFFASLTLRLELREDPSCRSAWSDGRVLAYNPAYIEAMPLAKVKGIQCHEALHLACQHHTRRKNRDKTLWNKACDYAINPLLREAGIELPNGWLDDAQHHGKSADAIYAQLRSLEEEKKGGAEAAQVQENNSEEYIDGASSGETSLGQGQEQHSSKEKAEASPESQEQSAGQAGESVESQAEDSDDPGMSGEVRDAPRNADGQGEGESLRLEEEAWDAALAQAVRKAREAGELPGGLERLVQERLQPRLNWREILRRFVSQAARNDFTWVRPNRRFLHAGLYLPGLENEELSEVAVAVDVSGSVSQPELDLFAGELSALLEEYETGITVLSCDAAISAQERLNRWDLPLRFEAKGGGGTEYAPVFERLEREGIAPACLIYFTDLQCAKFPQEPAYPVLWAAPRWEGERPPFGEWALLQERV